MDVFNDTYYLASLADSGEPCKKSAEWDKENKIVFLFYRL